MNRTTPPAAPEFKDLPPRRAHGERKEFTVSLEIVTPILGGGYRARTLDDVDVIRVPTVRGHLRFWWRALFAGGLTSSQLYVEETKLWGSAGGPGDKRAVRSPVEVRIDVSRGWDEDDSDINRRTTGAYALFPARTERRDGEEIKFPRRIGVAFELTVTAPAENIAAVRDAVLAWILFGGYGGRTRRGLGSLTVKGPDSETWLPRHGTPLEAERLRAELTRLFKRDVFAAGGPPRQVPMLAGAALSTIGAATPRCVDAWKIAVEALRLFRQGASQDPRATSGGDGRLPSEWARQPGPPHEAPSISNWPEADKIRRLVRSTKAYRHAPRYNATPAWPRAGFGLPIVGRFQTKGRNGNSYHEPPDFALKWRELEPDARPRERLASPLIIKALPIAGGQFVAIALWLHRDWPAGEVVLVIKDEPVRGSAARFDALTAPGDTPLFTALARKTLRAAFLDWLPRHFKVTAVFPPRSVGGGAR